MLDPRILALLAQQQRPGMAPITPPAPMVRPPGLASPMAAPSAGPTPAASHPGILDRLFPVPSDLQDLVSPQDAAEARRQMLLKLGSGLLSESGWQPVAPRLGQAIGQAMQGLPDWSQLLTGIAQRKLGLAGAEQQLSLPAQRRAILAKYPPAPNETPAQTGARLLRMLPEFMRIGDTQTVSALSDLLKSLGLGGPKASPTVHSGMHGDKPEEFTLTPDQQPNWLGIAPVPSAGGSDAADQRLFTREQTLSHGYTADTKNYKDAVTLLDGALGNVRAAKAGDGAAQAQLLYAFVKAMLPGQAVRQGEIELMNRAQPFISKMLANFDYYANNHSRLIPDAMAAQIANVLRQRRSDFVGEWGKIYQNYLGRAKRWKVDSTVFNAPAAQLPSATSTIDSLLAK